MSYNVPAHLRRKLRPSASSLGVSECGAGQRMILPSFTDTCLERTLPGTAAGHLNIAILYSGTMDTRRFQ